MDSFAAEITKLFNLQQLNLNNNQLTVVKAEWFKNLQNLDVLNLEANLLKGLDADAFRELIHLKRISLGKLRPQLGGWDYFQSICFVFFCVCVFVMYWKLCQNLTDVAGSGFYVHKMHVTIYVAISNTPLPTTHCLARDYGITVDLLQYFF